MTVDELLTLPKELHAALSTVFTVLYQRKYTGPVTFHFRNGLPKKAQIPSPEICLIDAEDPPTARPRSIPA
jgi:hypothetical protein